MSRVSRVLKRIDKEINGEPWTLWDKVQENVEFLWDKLLDKLLYWEIKQFCRNLPHFVKQAWWWREWDSSYTLETFCQNLERLGRSIRETDRHTTSSKSGNRAMYAAHLLRQAYSDEMSKEAIWWWDRNEFKSEEILGEEDKGMFRLSMVYRKGREEYEKKLHKLIRDRDERIVKERKAYAWAYTIKHFERWWS